MGTLRKELLPAALNSSSNKGDFKVHNTFVRAESLQWDQLWTELLYCATKDTIKTVIVSDCFKIKQKK